MLDEFERIAPSYAMPIPTDRWEVLALAQHHGLPTRLLDWSFNPYVAAWFAVASTPRPGQRRGVIWIHVPDVEDYVTTEERARSPFELRRTDPKRPVIFEPRCVTTRIRVQSGLFTVHQLDVKRKRFPAANLAGSHRACMAKAVIPPESFTEMRDELDLVGINAATLFPDLDGLSRKIFDSFKS
jgi:hypothetical protein